MRLVNNRAYKSKGTLIGVYVFIRRAEGSLITVCHVVRELYCQSQTGANRVFTRETCIRA